MHGEVVAAEPADGRDRVRLRTMVTTDRSLWLARAGGGGGHARLSAQNVRVKIKRRHPAAARPGGRLG